MLLKTGQCFTEELALNCPTIVACVTALPTGPAAVPGDALLGPDGQFHALPAFPAQVPQALTLTGQTLTLSNGGGSVTLPDSDAQALSIAGNVISLTNGGSVTLPTTAAPVPQTLSISGNTVSLSGGGGSVTVPDLDTQDLSLAGNVLSLTNGGSVTLPASSTPFATPAETVAGTSTTLAVNPADLYARENIPAQTGLSNNIAAIPAPGPAESVWGQNLLGETLHYSPALGWQIVAKLAGFTLPAYATVPPNTLDNSLNIVAPRAGRMTVSAYISALLNGTPGAPKTISCFINKGPIRFAETDETSTNNALDATATGTFNVAAGDVINITYINGGTAGNASTLYSWQYEA